MEGNNKLTAEQYNSLVFNYNMSSGNKENPIFIPEILEILNIRHCILLFCLDYFLQYKFVPVFTFLVIFAVFRAHEEGIIHVPLIKVSKLFPVPLSLLAFYKLINVFVS